MIGLVVAAAVAAAAAAVVELDSRMAVATNDVLCHSVSPYSLMLIEMIWTYRYPMNQHYRVSEASRFQLKMNHHGQWEREKKLYED